MNGRVTRAAVSLILLALAACGGDDNGTDPEPTGSVEVSALTTGALLDPDGYTVTVEGTDQPLGVNDTVTFAGVTVGSRSVLLDDVASNCLVTQANPQLVTVTANATTPAAFTVTCARPLEGMVLLAADREGTIYTVDETTGEATTLFVPVTDDGGELVALGVISSMVHVWETDSWWLGLGGQSVCPGCIHTFDASTGESTFLSDPSATIRAPAGMAVHPSTGSVYTSEGDGSSDLYELDTTTGALSTAISDIQDPGEGKGKTFANDSILLIGGADHVVSINMNTEMLTDLGVPTLTGFPGGTSSNLRSMTTRETDGTLFAMSRDSRTDPSHLATVDPATGDLTFVGTSTALLDGLAFIPARMVTEVAPADASRIVFVSDRTGNLEVFVMDKHGGNLVQVTDDLADDDDPTINPERSQVAFTSDRDGDWEIWVKAADGTGVAEAITSTTDNEWDPVFSPDGSRIVFTRQYILDTGNWDIFSMAADGSDVVQLTDNPELDANPAWSPNGQELVFISRTSSPDWEIHKTSATTLETPTRLTGVSGSQGVNIDPDWSPDGNTIAFASDRTGQFEIWTMDTDGNNQTQLTTNGGDEPNWSADGSQIVFSRGRDGARNGDFEIYIMNADGSGIRPISNTTAEDEEIDLR